MGEMNKDNRVDLEELVQGNDGEMEFEDNLEEEQELEQELDDALEDDEEEKQEKSKKRDEELDLPGLDYENGKFRIAGTLSASPIFRRKGPNTNIAKSCGYAVEELATGRIMYMTKMEGVALAARHKMVNAYIIKHVRNKKDKNGETIKTSETIYLQPYPAREESFTQDGRLISVFKLDQNNKLEHPLELMIEEDMCTKDFWLLIQKTYKQKKNRNQRRSKSKKRERNIAEKRRKRILEIEAEISKVSIDNPFE